MTIKTEEDDERLSVVVRVLYSTLFLRNCLTRELRRADDLSGGTEVLWLFSEWIANKPKPI